MTLKRAKMKASSRVNSRETSSGVRKRHFLATGEISVRLKNVQMVFDSFATFFILLGGLVILTHMIIGKKKKVQENFFPSVKCQQNSSDNKDKRDEENLRCNNRSRIVSRGCAARCLVVDKKDTKADHDFSFF